jgi:rRNA-processing protein FCF1
MPKGGDDVFNTKKKYMSQNERIAVLENQVKDLQDQVKTFLERQDILMSNDVALKQDIEEMKKPKEPQYFG